MGGERVGVQGVSTSHVIIHHNMEEGKKVGARKRLGNFFKRE